jgi:addiction module HigA family antidote
MTIHPGEILKEEFLVPLGLSAYRLARLIDVPQQRLTDLIAGHRSVTVDTALRLGQYFQGDARQGARFWLALQARHDLDRALDREGTRDELAAIASRGAK